MFNGTSFRDLVSGRHQGIGPAATRALLRIAETPYTLAVNWRNRRYDRGHADIHRAGVPVVSVGNLSLGGTGKTPLVKWLARWFCERGVRVSIVSRGYGAAAGECNDEALELAQALPDVPHIQNPDRVAAANRAVQEFAAQLLILDDGFQHRRLARDLDFVLLDALEPFGFDHVFPRGTLREPARNLSRAHVICLSRADAISPAERDAIRRRVAELASRALWCELAHRPSQLTNSAGETQPLDALRDRRVAAFCGIGNPTGFQHTLATTGCDFLAWTEFPDHYAYTAADLTAVKTLADSANAELIICTQKDLVKIQQPKLGRMPLWALTIEMQFLAGREELERALERIGPTRSPQPPTASP